MVTVVFKSLTRCSMNDNNSINKSADLGESKDLWDNYKDRKLIMKPFLSSRIPNLIQYWTLVLVIIINGVKILSIANHLVGHQQNTMN